MADGPQIDRPLPSSFDDDEAQYGGSGFQKLARKIKKEPLIPLGCILTVAAFTNAWLSMRRGDRANTNRMFRYRVYAQGFTVLTIVGGGFYYQADRKKEREYWKVKREADAEDKRQKWIRELEIRDEEDRMIREKLEKRRQKVADKGAASAPATEKKAAPSADAAAAPEKQQGQGWGAWLGLSSASKQAPSEPQPEAKKESAEPKAEAKKESPEPKPETKS